jgi:hypothetical protein
MRKRGWGKSKWYAACDLHASHEGVGSLLVSDLFFLKQAVEECV